MKPSYVLIVTTEQLFFVFVGFRTRRAMVDEISIFSIFLSSVAPTLLFVHPSDSDRREWLEPETQVVFLSKSLL